MTLTMDTQVWAEQQFGECDLKDQRRTRRLTRLAAEVLRHPAESLPEQTTDMADLKAAYRKIWYRKPAPKKENTTQRLARKRESELWGQVIDLAGRPPQGTQWVHVMDRGADNFEVYCHCLEQGVDWVVRVTQQPARTANVEVRFGPLRMPLPEHKSRYVRELAPAPLSMCVVYAVEVDAPLGAEPIRWILLTSLPVRSFQGALLVVGYYEQRWLIEEWHKALKTGCRVQQRQLKTNGRLEAVAALLGVVAVRPP